MRHERSDLPDPAGDMLLLRAAPGRRPGAAWRAHPRRGGGRVVADPENAHPALRRPGNGPVDRRYDHVDRRRRLGPARAALLADVVGSREAQLDRNPSSDAGANANALALFDRECSLEL